MAAPLAVSLRLAPHTLDRIDRELERLRARTPGALLTRSDVVRVLLAEALAAREAHATVSDREAMVG